MQPGADGLSLDPTGKQDLELSLTPVNRWRYGVFFGCGFDAIAAHRLAISSADVHKLVQALKNGCSLELALEIFV